MARQQLIYASHPVGYSAEIRADILDVSRRNNVRADITGALICRQDVYMQLLEGPDTAVDALLERLLDDERHENLKVLVRARVDDRLFPDWSMKCDPAKSWLWSPEEIRDGVLDSATPREVRAVFVRMANASVSNDL